MLTKEGFEETILIRTNGDVPSIAKELRAIFRERGLKPGESMNWSDAVPLLKRRGVATTMLCSEPAAPVAKVAPAAVAAPPAPPPTPPKKKTPYNLSTADEKERDARFFALIKQRVAEGVHRSRAHSTAFREVYGDL